MICLSIHFNDANPVFTCESCGARFQGDSVNDAFKSFWSHIGERHPGIFND